MQLFDLQGRLVRRAGWQGELGRVDVSTLTPGIYVYQLSGKGWKTSGKVVVE